MKWTTLLSLTFVILVLLVTGWLSYIGYLAKVRNRACLESPIENEGGTNSSIDRELQGVINDCSAQNGGIGLQVTVIFPDRTTWNGTSGYADLAVQCPLTLSHHLYLGSMTKLFTATLVMEQVEKGSLSLDEALNQWIHLPNAKNVSIRNLLTHRSGLPDYARDTWFQIGWFGLPNKTWQPNELMRVIQDKPLRFTAGSRHEYSNSNYLLL
ncbi:MAG TPA: serine hydrolase domain-containing protein, partial [Anaerolineales bacterium]|nr:serine hydrolase domain-containing protein [Anaerolineales bacterium]